MLHGGGGGVHLLIPPDNRGRMAGGRTKGEGSPSHPDAVPPCGHNFLVLKKKKKEVLTV